ncbi:MAG: nucleoside-diphosphate kinase [Bacteroidaceae bacterium]|nr:nucleoside-diphosphate kinase [Bacteroidaceae bacterium]
MLERTLVLLKPCIVMRGLMGEIITRFERKGLRIVGMKMLQMDDELLRQHYSHLVSKPFFPILRDSMQASPVVAMCVEGLEAVRVVRAMAGVTNGRDAAVGTIRGDYSMSGQQNVVHASDSPLAAKEELARFFRPDEVFDFGDINLDVLYAADEVDRKA